MNYQLSMTILRSVVRNRAYAGSRATQRHNQPVAKPAFRRFEKPDLNGDSLIAYNFWTT